jgi:hypothetical protein
MSIGRKWVVISPTGVRYEGDGPPDNQQISLRDYFAASAITGIVANGAHFRRAAVDAYAIADALLERRSEIV